MSTTQGRSKMWNIYNIEQKQNVDCLQLRPKAGSKMSTTYSKIECGISTTQSRVACGMSTTQRRIGCGIHTTQRRVECGMSTTQSRVEYGMSTTERRVECGMSTTQNNNRMQNVYNDTEANYGTPKHRATVEMKYLQHTT